jgi:hypothetical protein
MLLTNALREFVGSPMMCNIVMLLAQIFVKLAPLCSRAGDPIAQCENRNSACNGGSARA